MRIPLPALCLRPVLRPLHRSLLLGLHLALAGPVAIPAVAASSTAALGLPLQSPAAAGFSAERIGRVRALLRREVEAGNYSGAVWLIARDGQVADTGALGMRNLAKREPMTADTVFHIFSMTKIVTTVTVLSLIEEGRINLDDRVAKFLPQLDKLPVFTGGSAEKPELRPARRPVTIRHLLTHTSGLGYDFFLPSPLREVYAGAKLWESRSLEEFTARVSRLPLAHDPGDGWTYGVSTDVLGAVVAAVTGQPLESVMRERVFAPLGMKETSFQLTDAMRGRLARIYRRSAGGELQDAGMTDTFRTFASGGGGLYSTLHDYSRFAQMLLNEGELDGVRVLGRKTVEFMTRNQLGHLGMRPVGAPAGFGLGVRVQIEAADTSNRLSTPGQFGWEGIATTYVSIDPRERVVLLLLMQHQPFNQDGICEKFSNTAYQALEAR